MCWQIAPLRPPRNAPQAPGLLPPLPQQGVKLGVDLPAILSILIMEFPKGVLAHEFLLGMQLVVVDLTTNPVKAFLELFDQELEPGVGGFVHLMHFSPHFFTERFDLGVMLFFDGVFAVSATAPNAPCPEQAGSKA